MLTVTLNSNTGTVEARDETGSILWAERPLGYAVRKILPIAGTPDVMALLDRDNFTNGPFRNIVRLDGSGKVLWRANLPPNQGEDSYVAMSWKGDRFVANTGSTYRVTLDIRDGTIVDCIFTK